VLGNRVAQGKNFAGLSRLAYPAAAVVLIAALVVRASWTIHGVWEPFPGLFLKALWPVNKNNLSPLRLVPFFALVLLVATHVPRDARFLGSMAARPLVLCGQQSLEIFCLGILLSALGHFILSEYTSAIAIQLAVNAAGITTMCLTAKMIDWYKATDRMPIVQPAAPRGQGGIGGDCFRDQRLAEAQAEIVEQREARARRLCAAQILSRQHAAGQRAIGEQRHPFAKQGFGEVVVDIARDQAVAILECHRARDAELARDAVEFAHAP
jgi:hypothetical protein